MTKLIACALLITALNSCTEQSADCTCVNAFVDYTARVNVVYIVDGDTFDFEIDKEKIRVRILDIDCFETRRGDRLTEQAANANISEDSALALGILSKEFASRNLLNKTIVITRDSIESNFDVYGRLLRNVTVNGFSYAKLISDSLLLAN